MQIDNTEPHGEDKDGIKSHQTNGEGKKENNSNAKDLKGNASQNGASEDNEEEDNDDEADEEIYAVEKVINHRITKKSNVHFSFNSFNCREQKDFNSLLNGLDMIKIRIIHGKMKKIVKDHNN
jgi:outer membrane protein OmpA-like peptidoglycan-associated protein